MAWPLVSSSTRKSCSTDVAGPHFAIGSSSFTFTSRMTGSADRVNLAGLPRFTAPCPRRAFARVVRAGFAGAALRSADDLRTVAGSTAFFAPAEVDSAGFGIAFFGTRAALIAFAVGAGDDVPTCGRLLPGFACFDAGRDPPVATTFVAGFGGPAIAGFAEADRLVAGGGSDAVATLDLPAFVLRTSISFGARPRPVAGRALAAVFTRPGTALVAGSAATLLGPRFAAARCVPATAVIPPILVQSSRSSRPE